MESKLRDAVWKRDKGVCKECKRNLIEISRPTNPEKSISRELSAIKEIPIFKWSKNCWKCGEETPVVSYDFQAGFNYTIGDVEKLDMVLMEKYPFVRRVLSKTMGHIVIANTCVHCRGLQGNWFIREDLLEMPYEVDMNTLVDFSLPNNLTAQDLHHEGASESQAQPIAVRLSIGHVHHKDLNWENNDPDNLVLLCEDCHNRLQRKEKQTNGDRATKSRKNQE